MVLTAEEGPVPVMMAIGQAATTFPPTFCPPIDHTAAPWLLRKTTVTFGTVARSTVASPEQDTFFFRALANHEARLVLEKYQRNVERVANGDEPARFETGISIHHTPLVAGLACDDAHNGSAYACASGTSVAPWTTR